jgi:hypothetical protein
MNILVRISPLALADTFTWNNKEWQVITNPKDPGLQGNLLKFKARSGILEKDFYIQIES